MQCPAEKKHAAENCLLRCQLDEGHKGEHEWPPTYAELFSENQRLRRAICAASRHLSGQKVPPGDIAAFCDEADRALRRESSD